MTGQFQRDPPALTLCLFDPVSGTWACESSEPLADTPAVDVTGWKLYYAGWRYTVTAAWVQAGVLRGGAVFDLLPGSPSAPARPAGPTGADVTGLDGQLLTAWEPGVIAL